MNLPKILKLLRTAWRTVAGGSDGFSLISIRIFHNPVIVQQLGSNNGCKVTHGPRDHVTDPEESQIAGSKPMRGELDT